MPRAEPMCGHSEKEASQGEKPGTHASWWPSENTSTDGSSIMDIQAPELLENNILFFKAPNLWRFVMATWVEWSLGSLQFGQEAGSLLGTSHASLIQSSRQPCVTCLRTPCTSMGETTQSGTLDVVQCHTAEWQALPSHRGLHSWCSFQRA